MKIILLPGLDGTGMLFKGILEVLPKALNIQVFCLDELEGDSYAKNQFELSPTIGASFNGLQYATPYVELEGKNVSTSDDPFDISGANKYATIGAIVPLATTTDLDLSMVRTMDGDWSKTDNEIMALVVFKF